MVRISVDGKVNGLPSLQAKRGTLVGLGERLIVTRGTYSNELYAKFSRSDVDGTIVSIRESEPDFRLIEGGTTVKIVLCMHNFCAGRGFLFSKKSKRGEKDASNRAMDDGRNRRGYTHPNQHLPKAAGGEEVFA